MKVCHEPVPSKTNSRRLLSKTPFFCRLICSFRISHTCFSLSSRLPNNPKEDAFQSPTIDHTITESLSILKLAHKIFKFEGTTDHKARKVYNAVCNILIVES